MKRSGRLRLPSAIKRLRKSIKNLREKKWEAEIKEPLNQ